MSATFIGGNLDSIEQAASRLDQTASKALDTSSQSDAAAEQLLGAIDEAMNTLLTRFKTVADELSAEISQSHAELEGSDWQGTSRENALAIKHELQAQVNTILETATAEFQAERDGFHVRAETLVSNVREGFGTVMRNVDAEYHNLAMASRRTRENLLAADQTIRVS